MSKRAEEYANAQYPQTWVNRTPTSSEKVDYNERARWAARIAYEQAEEDLALTWVDIAKINQLHFEVMSEYDPEVITPMKIHEEVLRRFNEQRKK